MKYLILFKFQEDTASNLMNKYLQHYVTLCALWDLGFSRIFCALRFFFYVIIPVFHPCHNGQIDDWLRRISIPDVIHYLFCFPILILEKEPGTSLLMLSAEKGNHWYNFYNVFNMKCSLTGDWTRDLAHLKIELYH